MGIEHVNGKKKGDVILYALSTCGWCAKTKQLLKDLEIEFNFVYVDLLEGAEQNKVYAHMQKWNPRGSFPTLVIDNKKCIVGFQEEKIREALGL